MCVLLVRSCSFLLEDKTVQSQRFGIDTRANTRSSPNITQGYTNPYGESTMQARLLHYFQQPTKVSSSFELDCTYSVTDSTSGSDSIVNGVIKSQRVRECSMRQSATSELYYLLTCQRSG